MMYLRMYSSTRRRWSHINDTTEQQHIWNWRVAPGFQWSYNDCLKEEAKAMKCSYHRTVSLIVHTAKIVVGIFRRRIERKIEDALGNDQFGFRRGKGTRNAIGTLKIIPKWTLDIDKGTWAWFTDWQKAFNNVQWSKLMQILKASGINWHNRLICKLYTDQWAKIRLEQGETRSVKTLRPTRMLFVTDSIQLTQRIPYQRSSWRVWRPQCTKTSNLQCKTCRWPCATS